ncbi:MAG: hypothetical protein JRE47_12025 [Deltaproteobacteria bacterium]|nr:hypothetical protein [Deltaproteobacteria bacterium]
MQAISPRLGELLVKTTRSRDIDDAFQRIFSEYLTLKIASLVEIIKGFNKKWGMDFNEFKKKIKSNKLKKDAYAFDVEQDFWEWEEAETLKTHYEELAAQWK